MRLTNNQLNIRLTDDPLSQGDLQVLLGTARAVVDEAIDNDFPVSLLEGRQRYAVAFLTWTLLTHLGAQTRDAGLDRPIGFTADYVLGDEEMSRNVHSRLSAAAPGLGFNLDQPRVSLLTPSDIQQYTALALDGFRDSPGGVPSGYADELRRLGYETPHRHYQPDAMTVHDLLPPPTRCPERQPMEAKLHALLDTGDLLQQRVVVLLLWVNSRDHAVDLNVIDVLMTVRGILDAARRNRGRPAALKVGDARIRACLDAAVKKLKLRTCALIQTPTAWSWERCADLALHKLWGVRAFANGDVRAPSINLEPLFWDEFRSLDWILKHQDLPDDTFEVQFELIMVGAMLKHEISPGSAVSDMQKVAAQNLGVDVLWNWQAFLELSLGDPFYLNAASLFCLVQMIRIARSAHHLLSQQDRAEALSCARKLAGHLLACCASARVRLPQHQRIQTYLEELGEISTVPLTVVAYQDVEETAIKVIFAVSTRVSQFSDLRPSEEERAAPEQGPAPDDMEPPHLRRARELMGGKHVVMIGGTVDERHHQNLVDTLGLRTLDWIPADRYAHGTHAAHRVQGKADFLLIAVRWMGHAHSALSDVVRRDEKTSVVYLPGGLNPSMVAWQVCQQAKQKDAEGQRMRA